MPNKYMYYLPTKFIGHCELWGGTYWRTGRGDRHRCSVCRSAHQLHDICEWQLNPFKKSCDQLTLACLIGSFRRAASTSQRSVPLWLTVPYLPPVCRHARSLAQPVDSMVEHLADQEVSYPAPPTLVWLVWIGTAGLLRSRDNGLSQQPRRLGKCTVAIQTLLCLRILQPLGIRSNSNGMPAPSGVVGAL
jgi:hypothetical protein